MAVDGRWYVIALAFVLPAALIGVTIWKFGSNPLSLLVLFGVVVLGGFYMTTYYGSDESPTGA